MNSSGKIKNQPKDKENLKQIEPIQKIRHSLAHIMAQAVVERFQSDGVVLLGVGPAIDDGFYYDFDLPRAVKEEDLLWIESRVKEIVKSGVEFQQSFVSKEEALACFEHQPYKLELIELISSGNLNADGMVNKDSNEINEISIFKHGNFIDLCQGPHVESSLEINPDALKILRVNGAYWRSNENNPMLSRFYATAFHSVKDLEEHLKLLEEKHLYDHRKIGKRLELFHFDDSAPGMPYWLPNGLIVLNELIAYWRIEHQKRNYQEFSAPMINHKKLWQVSGHWEHYKENMFLVPKDDNTIYGIKPMNCPNAMVVYNLKLRSYKDLPLRLSDCDVLHRNENSGTLHGLLRLQKFQQDDAHIFLKPDQIENEIKDILDIAKSFYELFDMEYSFRLSGRPKSFVGEISEWDQAENILANVLNDCIGEKNYSIADEEGAFYGPKIDIMMHDSLNRSWQMGTIQLDFQLPKRFNCKYVEEDGSKVNPVVIHRVIYGSIDRFIGILLEHTKGNLPIWLSPQQVAIIPISENHIAYCESLEEKLLAKNIRCSTDSGNSSLNKRIRNAVLKKIPYLIIVGDKEVESNSVSIRQRNKAITDKMPTDKFISKLQSEISSRC